MENEELIKQVTEKAEKWLTPAYDAETQAEIKKMLANPDKTDLIEAFYKDLEFGTGGLRGIMGVGSNRMNIYTVGAATQGLSNYLNKNFKDLDQISVVVVMIAVTTAVCLRKFLPIFFQRMVLKYICLKICVLLLKCHLLSVISVARAVSILLPLIIRENTMVTRLIGMMVHKYWLRTIKVSLMR